MKQHEVCIRRVLFVSILLAASVLILANLPGARAETHTIKSPEIRKLYAELANKGWIIYSAKSQKGDYDLFISRPNGSGLRNITQSPEFNEVGPRFFPDGKRILYRRVSTSKPLTEPWKLTYGELVIANIDGSNPRPVGREGEYPWATLSGDGKQIACLYKEQGKIRIFDLATLEMVKELPREGIFQQPHWSPDGQELCGTANVQGHDWNIITYGIDTGKVTLISRSQNCTPNWFPNSRSCIFSHRNTSLVSDDGGAKARALTKDPNYSWTMLMMADAEGKQRQLVVAEQYKHLYYACVSPDNKYVIYCRSTSDGPSIDGPLAVIRLSDTPLIDGSWLAVENQYAKNAKRGPILHLDLPPGLLPDWTYTKLAVK